MTSQLFICISRDRSKEAVILFFGHVVLGDIVVRGRYELNLSTVLMGREPSRDLL